MAREKPVCQSGPTWIKVRLEDRNALAPLTGQDWPALQAFFHLVQLYGNSDDQGRHCAVLAMTSCVCAMQPSTRRLAKAGIPHVLDWAHEGEIWSRIAGEIALVTRKTRSADPLGEALNSGDGVYRP